MMAVSSSILGIVLTILVGSVSFALGSDDIGSICQTLWDADTNSLRYDLDFELNLQNHVSYSSNYDRASRKLFSRVDETKLRGPTFTAFKALLNNYDINTGSTEYQTSAERSENNRFLTAIMATKTMKALHTYLKNKRLAQTKESLFKEELKVMWLYFYRRKAYRDSSGFEHVFLGELSTKNRVTQVSGFHNWLQFYIEEKKINHANYYGYYKIRKSVAPTVIKLKLSWYHYLKPVTSFLLGTSPEFEIALYTVCFKLRPNQECSCNINGQQIIVQTYSMKKKYIGTAFVI